MNSTEPKQKETYETPEVFDIKPVTICVKGDNSVPDGDNDDEWGS